VEVELQVTVGTVQPAEPADSASSYRRDMGMLVGLEVALVAVRFVHMVGSVHRGSGAAVEAQKKLECAMALVLEAHIGPMAEAAQVAAEDVELPSDSVHMVLVEVVVVDAEPLDILGRRNLDLR
jgi:hypothetical protein